MTDVYVRVDHLNRLNGSLKQIIVEFHDAAQNADALQSLIRKPDERTELYNRTQEFESNWDDRRKALIRKLENIQVSVESTCEGWQDFDLELSRELALEENAGETLPRR